ncbi:MAG: phosphatase PAP2 family protein [Bacteroidetes bacterium]|nr:phosphatase PAP2 family protein [Bacteroidota bacterium]
MRYLLLMVVCYAVWVPLYFLTGWIGTQRGAAFDPALQVDQLWPFVPEAVFVYLLAYIIVVALFFIRRSAAFLDYAYLNFIIMNLLAFFMFALLPAAGPSRSDLPGEVPAILAFMFELDVQWNAFPSLHVANPVLITLLSFRERGVDRVSIGLLAIAVAISVSTLLVRQHYLLDVIGGIALAVVVFVVLGRWRSPIPGKSGSG